MRNWALIPEARRDAVRAALSATFGTAAADDFQLMKGGVSGALIGRFEVREGTYVLRLEPERIALNDRRRHYACMTVAADAGAAPSIHYADPVTGVAIMDFVSRGPLSAHTASAFPGGSAGLVRALGSLVARVQATPPFPMIFGDRDPIGLLLAQVGASSPFLAPGQLDPHAEGFVRIRAALPWDVEALVSCHNDPNPRNILFDGDRLWLVDWELGSRHDPLMDVAIMTTNLPETPEIENTLLEAAFGAPSNDALRARLSVIWLLARLSYGCIVLDSLAGALQPIPDTGAAALTPAGFRAAVEAGQLAAGTPEIAYAFAKMSLLAFLDGVAAPGFGETLKLAMQG